MASKTNKTLEAAATLFSVTADKVPGILYALNLRQACGRCGGSGHYSFNLTSGTKCFGCGGHGFRAAILTPAVLEAARVKVEAGELVALRAAYKAKMAARKEIAPLVAKAREIYMTIGNAYEAWYQATRTEVCGGETAPVQFAQSMNNSLYYGDHVRGRRECVSDIESDVRTGGRRDYLVCKAQLEGLVADLEALRAAWLAFTA